jgi:hypothetical protein
MSIDYQVYEYDKSHLNPDDLNRLKQIILGAGLTKFTLYDVGILTALSVPINSIYVAMHELVTEGKLKGLSPYQNTNYAMTAKDYAYVKA